MREPDRHFEIRSLAPGVWAAEADVDGWLVGNAGIVDLGDRTLLFDTGLTPNAGAALGRASVELTGRSPDLVLLSHYHNDHVRGAVGLPDVPVASTARTRDLLDTDGREELAIDQQEAAGRVARVAHMVASDDPMVRAAARLWKPYAEGLAATAPGLELRLPDETFEGDLALHGRDRRAVFRTLGGGHSGDDGVLVLPDDGVVFCSDLLFVAFHPFVADGDVAEARAALGALANLGATTYVPGHGPPSGPAALTVQRDYLDTIVELAAAARRDGIDPGTVPIPADTRDWGLAIPFFHANLRFLVGD